MYKPHKSSKQYFLNAKHVLEKRSVCRTTSSTVFMLEGITRCYTSLHLLTAACPWHSEETVTHRMEDSGQLGHGFVCAIQQLSKFSHNCNTKINRKMWVRYLVSTSCSTTVSLSHPHEWVLWPASCMQDTEAWFVCAIQQLSASTDLCTLLLLPTVCILPCIVHPESPWTKDVSRRRDFLRLDASGHLIFCVQTQTHTCRRVQTQTHACRRMQTHAKLFSCILCPSCYMFRPWVSPLSAPILIP